VSAPTYDCYRKSGVEWLGEVPSHWNVKRLAHYFDERRTKVSDAVYPPLSVTKNGIVPQLDTAAKTDDGDNRKLVLSGDFVINSRSDRKGSSGLSRLDGSVSLINTVLTPQPGMVGNFAHHLLRSVPFQEEYYRYGKGIVADLWSTNFSEARNIVLAVPPPAEQAAIAAFLDRETGKIDALVEAQTRLIELLKEKRQAVISHAGTKGLDPAAPMKDSGVEWLGQVPAHWEVQKLGSICSKIGSGKTPSGGAEAYVDAGIAFLRSQNVYDEGLWLDELVYIPEAVDEEMSNTRVQPGDVLLNITGASLGRTCIVPEPFERANVNQHVCIIRLQDVAQRDFVSMAMKSISTKGQIDATQNGAAREGLNFQQIAELRVALPPENEASVIVKAVCAQIGGLDRLTEQAEAAISLLQERRAALISAAVTGKIDVRGLAPQQAEAA